MKATLKRGDTVTLTHNSNTWVLRTPEELALLEKRDRDAGRWHDDAGEPILYGPYTCLMGSPSDRDFAPFSVTLKVTSLRPKWVHYTRRPKGLMAAQSPDVMDGREVLFTLPG